MRIAKHPDVTVTPHTARVGDQAQLAVADQFIDNVENFVAGKSTNPALGAF